LYSSICAQDDTIEVVEFRFRELVRKRKPDIVHLHWPDVFVAAGTWRSSILRLTYLRMLFIIAQARGIKMVWTAHNLKRRGQRHSGMLNRLFWGWFLRSLDGIIYMTRAAQDSARGEGVILCDERVIRHGHYRPVIPELASAPTGVPTSILIGKQTSYKGGYAALQAHLRLATGSARLIIAGGISERTPDESLRYALQQLTTAERVTVHQESKFLPDTELYGYISEADLALFPYSFVQNSGAAILALSLDKPILASRIPPFVELQELVGSEWVWLFDGELDSKTLEDALDRASRMRSPSCVPNLESLSWEIVATETISFYKSVLSSACRIAGQEFGAD